MDKAIHNVNELAASARTTVETLMGHPLRDDQQLFIVALDGVSEPPQEQRRTAWTELKSMLEVMQQNASQSGRSPQEIDRLIDEACDSVRYGG